jgi:hypothetical protein
VIRRRHRLLLAAGLTVSVGPLTGCGTDPGRTALAIEATRWAEDGTLVVATECARLLEAEVGRDHGGSDLPQVTVWGRPEVGRCEPEVVVTVPRDAAGGLPTKIVDGTTAMVVDLPAPTA